MIKLIIYFVCAILLFRVIKFVLAYFIIGYKKNKAYKLFLNTNRFVTNECHLIYQALPTISNTFVEQKNELQNLSNTISEISKLDDSYENIDRKIALYGIMTKQFDNILINICDKDQYVNDKNLLEIINQYNKLQSDINYKKQLYNKAADSLRHSAEVFPTSFFARLRKIIPVDSYNL